MSSESLHIQCPDCSRPILLEDLVSGCYNALPARGWASFTCPHCKSTDNRLWFRQNTESALATEVCEGIVDGYPGPNFIVHQSIMVPGMNVKSNNNGLSITWNERVWQISAGAGTHIECVKDRESTEDVVYLFSVNGVQVGKVVLQKETHTIQLLESYSPLVEDFYSVVSIELLRYGGDTYLKYIDWTE